MSIKEKIEDIVDPAVGPTLEIVSGLFLEGALSTIVPGVGNALLSYKQQRLEKRIMSAITELVNRQNELNQILSEIREDLYIKMKNEFFALLMDSVIEEKQEEKVKLLVNGYVNIGRIEEPIEDVIMSFYDVMSQISLLEIMILKAYYTINGTPLMRYWDIVDQYKLESSQCDMIKEKLARLGLLLNINEAQREENVDAIFEFLNALINNKKNNKLKAKKVPSTERYKITSYGRNFIDFFIRYQTLHEDGYFK